MNTSYTSNKNSRMGKVDNSVQRNIGNSFASSVMTFITNVAVLVGGLTVAYFIVTNLF